MTKDNDINDIASKTLGSANSYATFTNKFDSNLINPMPRNLARDHWSITGKEFVGFDVWHCHEATFLTNKGLPVAGTLKFIYSADSKYMIESKSAKLYLNSFDMCKMGEDIETASRNYINQIKKDLSEKLETNVQVNFFLPKDYNVEYNFPEEFEYDAVDLLTVEGVEDIEFTDYEAKENHLRVEQSFELGVQSYFTNVLRSRCRHTKQKDTGAVYFCINSKYNRVVPSSLLKHVVSLREVNEFHEFCCEKMFCDLKSKLDTSDELFVAMLYSRRGSLDINPVRANSLSVIEGLPILDINTITEKVQGQ